MTLPLSTPLPSTDRVGVSLMHFHQQTVSSGLRNLCHSPTGHTHPAGRAPDLHYSMHCVLLTLLSRQWQSPLFSISLSQRRKGGERSGGGSLVWAAAAAADCPSSPSCCIFSLTHTYMHTHAEWGCCIRHTHVDTHTPPCRLSSALRVVPQRGAGCWRLVWGAVAWHRLRHGGRSEDELRHQALTIHDDDDPDIHLNLARTFLFILQGVCVSLFVCLFVCLCVCVCVVQTAKSDLIFILGKREVTPSRVIASEVERTSYFQFLPTVKREERWSSVGTSRSVQVCHLSVPKCEGFKRRAKKQWTEVTMLRLQGCQVLLFFITVYQVYYF